MGPKAHNAADVDVLGIDDRGRRSRACRRRLLQARAPSRPRIWRQRSDGRVHWITDRASGGCGSSRRIRFLSFVGLLSELRQPILAMSLLESPTGHLTNLSSATRCAGGIGFRDALADGGEGVSARPPQPNLPGTLSAMPGCAEVERWARRWQGHRRFVLTDF